MSFTFLKLSAAFLSCCLLLSATPADQKSLKVGLVNFKKCVEESKLGKQEQATFETLKGKMESVVEEKEKELNVLAEKLNDPDQLDLMSAEAETELKRKFRALSQEMNQLQTQYYQSLNQTNMKIVQSLADVVANAAEKVAKNEQYDLLLNDESAFFYDKALDVSSKIVVQMDQFFEEEAQKIAPTK